MTSDPKRLQNAITVLTSRRDAIVEELADTRRMKTASPEVLQKRIEDLNKDIDARKAKLTPAPEKPPKT